MSPERSHSPIRLEWNIASAIVFTGASGRVAGRSSSS
jgi:hypothetical protein